MNTRFGKWAGLLGCLLIILGSSALWAQEAPALTLREGHQSQVIAVKALGPDKIATVSTNGSLKVWNTEEGGVLLTLFPSGVGELDAKIGQVSQAVFTPSGDALGVCVPGETPTVTAFDMNTEEVRATISLPEPVQCLAMSEEAVYVQTDSKLSRFDLDGRAAGSWSLPPTPERPPTKSLLGWEVGGAPECAYSLGAGVVALSQRNGSSITFLEGKTLTPIRTVSTPPVYRMCFSPDGERLVITHRTGIAIYETRTGEATGDGIDWKVPDEIPGPGYQPFWVSESRIVLFNGYSDDIYPSLLDWEVGKKPIGDKLEQGGKSAALDGQGALVIGTFDGTILVEETPGRYRELAAKSGQVTTMAESPDGSLVFGTTWGDIVFWDGKTGQPTRRFQVSGTVEALDLSPDGRFLGAVVSEKPGRKAMFWDLETGETTSVVNSDNREIVDAICLLNGGKAYVVNFERQTDILVDVRSGEVLARRAARGPTDTVYIAEKDWILQLSSMNLFTVLDASDNLSQVVEYKLPFQIYTGLRPDPQRKSLYICGIPTALCKWDLDAPEKAPETLYLDPLRAEKQYQGGLGIVVDEDRIFLATIDGLLHQFDKSGTITKEINLHVQLAKDHQRLKSGRIAFLTRGRVAFADPESGKLLGYLGLLPDNEGWAAIARDGTFDGNEEGLARIDIRIGNKHYSMGQLFLEYFRPGTLAQMIGEIPTSPQVSKPLTEANLSEPPKVEITSPVSGDEVTSKMVQVRVSVTDRGGGVSGVGLYHNGHKLPAQGVKSGEDYLFEVEMVSGMNEIRATAFDKAGEIEARQDQIRVRAPKLAKETPKLHLLAVGIENYPGISPLKFSKDDAEAFSQKMESRQFEPGKRVILTDSDASREALFAAFEEIASVAKPEDAFIFYFAGHGVGGDKSFYFLPQDADLTSDSTLASSSISSRDLAEKLTLVPATRQLVILDACHSGAFAKALTEEAGSPAGLQHVWSAHYLSRMAGTFMLAASASDQSAAEVEELGHGVLTYALLQSLEEAEGDEEMTVNLLLSLVTRGVRRLAKKFEGVDQNVVQFSSGQDFSLF